MNDDGSGRVYFASPLALRGVFDKRKGAGESKAVDNGETFGGCREEEFSLRRYGGKGNWGVLGGVRVR